MKPRNFTSWESKRRVERFSLKKSKKIILKQFALTLLNLHDSRGEKQPSQHQLQSFPKSAKSPAGLASQRRILQSSCWANRVSFFNQCLRKDFKSQKLQITKKKLISEILNETHAVWAARWIWMSVAEHQQQHKTYHVFVGLKMRYEV